MENEKGLVRCGLEKIKVKGTPDLEGGRQKKGIENKLIHTYHISEKHSEKSKNSFLYPPRMISKFLSD
jgi:hypothetical protein